MATLKISGIYEIVNVTNGKRYVGSAVSIATRWQVHRNQLRSGKHKNRYLQAAWVKYGEAAFDFRVLIECEQASLIEQEQVHIDALSPEYNLSPTAGSTLGVKYSDSSRRKLSEAMMGKALGRKRSPESIEKTAAAHRGKTRPPETGRKISEKLSGRARDKDAVERIAEKLRGRKLPKERTAHLLGNTHALGSKHSDEVNAAKAARMLGRSCPKSPEHRAKLSEALKGIPHSPERRAAQAAAQTGKKRGPYKKKSAEE